MPPVVSSSVVKSGRVDGSSSADPPVVSPAVWLPVSAKGSCGVSVVVPPSGSDPGISPVNGPSVVGSAVVSGSSGASLASGLPPTNGP